MSMREDSHLYYELGVLMFHAFLSDTVFETNETTANEPKKYTFDKKENFIYILSSLEKEIHHSIDIEWLKYGFCCECVNYDIDSDSQIEILFNQAKEQISLHDIPNVIEELHVYIVLHHDENNKGTVERAFFKIENAIHYASNMEETSKNFPKMKNSHFSIVKQKVE